MILYFLDKLLKRQVIQFAIIKFNNLLRSKLNRDLNKWSLNWNQSLNQHWTNQHILDLSVNYWVKSMSRMSIRMFFNTKVLKKENVASVKLDLDIEVLVYG